MANIFTEQLYRFIKWNLDQNPDFTISYGQLAFLFVVEMPDVYNAVNELVKAGSLECEALTQLGDGDYEIKFS